MSVVLQRKYRIVLSSAVKVPAKIREKKKRDIASTRKRTRPRASASRRRRGTFLRHVRVCGEGEEGGGASVPKGSGGRSDGGTVVVVVAEQRGVTWGYTTWGPGPSGPGWRRRKCAAYIRPGTDGNQHPVHSWTHPEHRESKNENPGTSSARAVVIPLGDTAGYRVDDGVSTQFLGNDRQRENVNVAGMPATSDRDFVGESRD